MAGRAPWLGAIVEYDANGNVTKTKDEGNHETVFVYDSLNRLSTSTDPLGNQQLFTYDANGNIITLTQKETENGGSSFDTFVLKYEYDALNRQTVSKDEADNTTTKTYDPRGNLVSVQDPNGSVAYADFDELNRRVRMRVQYSGTNELTTRWEFDKNGRMTKTIDGNGNQTAFAYDALDRQTAESYADSYYTTFQYDLNSNVSTRIDQNGTQTVYGYDTLNRLTSKSLTLGSGVVGESSNATFAYDALNRLIEAFDSDSRVYYKYNTLGKPEEEEMRYDAGNLASTGRIVRWDYDSQGRVAAVRYPDATSSLDQLNYSYDAVNRMTQLRRQTSSSAQEDMAKWYFKGPRLTRKEYGNGTFIKYSYDSRRNVSGITHYFKDEADPTPDPKIAEFSYQYDAAGRMTAEGIKQYTNGQAGTLEESGFNFVYDKASRLTCSYSGVPMSQIGTFPPSTYGAKVEYAFDANGNRTTVTTTPPGRIRGPGRLRCRCDQRLHVRDLGWIYRNLRLRSCR